MRSIDTLLASSPILATKVPLGREVAGLSQSTRDLVPGGLFFAVRGSQRDGHEFVDEALARGAVAAVVESEQVYNKSAGTIWVSSSRDALGKAADKWNGSPTERLKLVGVTGTNGKTTSTFLLSGIWRNLERRVGLVGTVEYQIGERRLDSSLTTPDALTLQALFARMCDEGVTHAAMEVSSIALDQFRVSGCRFEAALFTNFTPDHLDYHDTMSNYLAAKQRLFVDCAPTRAIFNADDPATTILLPSARAAELFTFTTRSSGADFAVESCRFDERGLQARVQTPSGPVELRSPLLGMHNLANCLGVLTTEFALGTDPQVAAAALSANAGAPGRLERVASAHDRPHVFVDYAHTEDALENVLNCLQQVRTDQGAKIVTVFGCGGDRDKIKRPRMASVAARLSDVVVATSDNPRTEDPESILDEVVRGLPTDSVYYRQSDRRKAIQLALEMARPGDLVLIAGKGHENYQILGTEKVPFDDRDVVREFYSRD